MTNETVPKVPPRKAVDIDNRAYQTLCKVFAYPQNAFQPYALAQLLDFGGLEQVGLTYGVVDLAYGEEAKYDPIAKEILLSEDTYFGLQQDRPRARFTFAHELGHAILHGKFLTSALEGRVPQVRLKRSSLRAFEDPEWQANRFAGAFLMPDCAIGKLLREGWSLAKIAKYFNVSLTAAQIRIEKLRNKP